MAEQDGGQGRGNEQNEGQQGHSATGTAVKAVAAAAATGAAAYAARKALSKNGESSGGNGGSSERSSKQEQGGIMSSIFSGSWDAARDQLVPLAEDAAGAAGKFVAENGPEIVRDRIVPKFISSFESAHGR